MPPILEVKMMRILLLLLTILVLFSCKQQEALVAMADRSLQLAEKQYKMLDAAVDTIEGVVPKTYSGKRVRTAVPKSWICGFYPGTLWYLYENSRNDSLRLLAEKYTKRIEDAKNQKWTHDLGFMIHCSYGNGYRLTGNPYYLEVMKTATENLASRFNERIGVIQSWGARPKWQYPVIIDNMMNLEMLEYMSRKTGNKRYDEIARSHADRTMEHHFRKDNSCYHVVSYEKETGLPHAKNTHQGYSDSSAWSRGQAWALYGYTMMYRETNDKRYLQQAVRVAEYLTEHPKMPKDKVPYWDFDAPTEPKVYRDASAAAIMASALLELGKYDSRNGKRWRKYAIAQLRSLSSPAYQAEEGTNGGFILKHSVGNLNKRSEVDVPLTYADYYYVEALSRLKKILNEE